MILVKNMLRLNKRRNKESRQRSDNYIRNTSSSIKDNLISSDEASRAQQLIMENSILLLERRFHRRPPKNVLRSKLGKLYQVRIERLQEWLPRANNVRSLVIMRTFRMKKTTRRKMG